MIGLGVVAIVRPATSLAYRNEPLTRA